MSFMVVSKVEIELQNIQNQLGKFFDELRGKER